MPPYQWPEKFDTQYDCMVFGYEESIKKMQEIGRTEINKHNMFVKIYLYSNRNYLIHIKPCNFRARTLTGPKAPHLHRTCGFKGCRTEE